MSLRAKRSQVLSLGKVNPFAKRDFLKRAGSNFILKDRTFLFSYSYPYSLVAETDPTKGWLSLSDKIRTFFKEGAFEIPAFAKEETS